MKIRDDFTMFCAFSAVPGSVLWCSRPIVIFFASVSPFPLRGLSPVAFDPPRREVKPLDEVRPRGKTY